MSPSDQQLQRLLKAASQVPEGADAVPAALEQQVLTALRMRRKAGDDLAMQRFLSGMMLCACLLLLGCFLWTRVVESSRAPESLTLANSSIQLSFLP
jgi:type VI protein secretion system component VasF